MLTGFGMPYHILGGVTMIDRMNLRPGVLEVASVDSEAAHAVAHGWRVGSRSEGPSHTRGGTGRALGLDANVVVSVRLRDHLHYGAGHATVGGSSESGCPGRDRPLMLLMLWCQGANGWPGSQEFSGLGILRSVCLVGNGWS